MGYESRLYIVKENKAVNYAEIIARFDCSEMKTNFRKLFKKPLESKMYAEDGNTLIEKDCYGEKLTKADFPTVIAWPEKEVDKDNYRRLKPLLSLLKGFDLSQWQDGKLQIVHYGY